MRITNVHFTTRQVSRHSFENAIKFIGFERDVELTPPNGVLGVAIFYNEFVFWRSSSEFSCIDAKRARAGQATLT